MPPLHHIDTWVFDLDNTLYPASSRLFDQVDSLIGQFVSELLGIPPEEARRVQKQYFREHGTTLAGLMARHNVDPHAYLEFVHNLDLSPIEPSPALAAALRRLPGRKLIYTNGSVSHAERVMDRLGVRDAFEGIFDIVASNFVPKPQESAYRKMLAQYGVFPQRAAMIEDLPRNLVTAAALGMTTVLVRSDVAWAQDDADGDHIHHVTDDLVAWLESVVPEPVAAK